MKFKETLGLLSSLFIKLFGISILFGLIAWSFNLPILGMCLIGFIFNFIVGTAFTYIYNYKHEKLIVEQNKALLEYESKKTAKVQCAFCHTDNIVPIDLSNTKFKCTKCHHANRLIVNFDAAQITVPQSTDDMIGRAVET